MASLPTGTRDRMLPPTEMLSFLSPSLVISAAVCRGAVNHYHSQYVCPAQVSQRLP
jgi:hypothetical protein